jgi:diguanylate cyclase (GGDEF)-like protein
MPSEPLRHPAVSSEQAATEDPSAALALAQKNLEKVNRLLGVALDNVASGLSIFDGDQRLVVCNKKFRDIYGLSESQTEPGTPLIRLAEHLGNPPEASAQGAWIERLAGALNRGETALGERKLADGCIVRVTSRPLSDGGWVEIHEPERRQDAQSIAWLKSYDPLTEVASSLSFGEELENALQQMRGGGVSFAIHWVDVDRFAKINQAFGTAVGDAVLRNVAERLSNTVRKRDLVARLGGDEFAIIQAGIKTRDQAERLAQRLLHALGEPIHVDGRALDVTASIGVALAPEHGTSSLELIKNVYITLASAKAAGRATYVVCAPSAAGADD